MSVSLWPHRLQHARLPCPSLAPGVCSDSCPFSRWCCLMISFSAAPSPLSSIFPNFRVFSSKSGLCIRWAKDWSYSFSISPFNEYSGLVSFRIDWFDLLLSKWLSKVFSRIKIWKHPFFGAQLSLWSNSHIRTWLLEKTITLTILTFVGKVLSLLFNTLVRFVFTFYYFIKGKNYQKKKNQSIFCTRIPVL